MTTQIHKCHPRDTEEQLYDVPLHDVELNDVTNVRHKSASSCVPRWLHGILAHYLMLFPRKAYKHQMPTLVWIRTLHGCPPHHVLTNLSLNMYHKQPRRIDWYGLDIKKKGGGAILEIWRCEEPHFELLLGYMARRHPMSPYSKSPWSKDPTVAWVKLYSE